MKELAVLVLLAIPAIAPLTYPGFFQTHRTFIPIYNLYDLAVHFPHLSWNPLGEGGLLAYYVAWGFHKLGLPGVEAVKAVYGLGIVLGAMGIYLWCSRWAGKRAALVAALIYVYLPYNLATIYIRGALDEALFLGLLPWLFWGLRPLGQRQEEGTKRAHSLSGYIVAVLVGGLLALCHPGLALIGLIAAGIYALFHRRWIFPLAMPVVYYGTCKALALLNPMGRLFPASGEFFGHFVLPFQLFSASWSFSPSTPGWIEDMPFQLGVVAMALGFFTALRWLRDRDGEVGFSLGLTCICIFLSLPPAALFWRISGVWRWLEYPWQVLVLAGLGLAVLAGAVLKYEQRLNVWPFWAGLITLTLLGSYRYLEPNFVSQRPRPVPLAIVGDNNAILVDCSYERLPEPGGAIKVKLLWQAVRPFDADYTVFVHLVDQADRKWGQRDQMPLNGEKPTSQWKPGELILDEYPIEVSKEAPTGPFNLAIGMYRWDTGERLPVRGREDGRALIPLNICHFSPSQLQPK